MQRVRRGIAFLVVLLAPSAFAFLAAGCRDTTDMAEPTSTPAPPASFVRLGWRWEPSLATERPSAGLALVDGGVAVFTEEAVEWPSKDRLGVAALGVSGRILDVAAGNGERWVLATTCADCADPKAVLERIGPDGKPQKGLLIDRPAGGRTSGRVWAGEPGPRVALSDEHGSVVFTERRDGSFTEPTVVDDAMRDIGSTHEAGEDLIAGVKDGNLTVAERSGTGGWTVRSLGRLERFGPELAPAPFLSGGEAAVAAPDTGAVRSASLFLYRRGPDAWKAHKIPQTESVLSFVGFVGGNGKWYLLTREAAQARLYDLSDLAAAPRVIPGAGGLSPIAAAVDAQGRFHAAMWVKGLVWRIAPADRDTTP